MRKYIPSAQSPPAIPPALPAAMRNSGTIAPVVPATEMYPAPDVGARVRFLPPRRPAAARRAALVVAEAM